MKMPTPYEHKTPQKRAEAVRGRTRIGLFTLGGVPYFQIEDTLGGAEFLFVDLEDFKRFVEACRSVADEAGVVKDGEPDLAGQS